MSQEEENSSMGVDSVFPPSRKEIASVLRKHPLVKFKNKIKKAFLVGSFVKGHPGDGSDIDVLLEIDPEAGFNALEMTEFSRRGLQEYFMKNKIRGAKDEVHPQWCGRRVDFYLTYNAELELRPKMELPEQAMAISADQLVDFRRAMLAKAETENLLEEWDIKPGSTNNPKF